MLEVAVIGGGAAGLAASRHLIGHGLRPSIFEAQKSIGGAWNTTNNKTKMWNGLITNLSKHTCRFSDWPWQTEGMSSSGAPTSTPFPSATDMGQYLESYAHNFVADPTCFQYQCQVTNIESLPSSNAYRVEWTDLATSTKHSKDFEGVVVATGFFTKPHFPPPVENKQQAAVLLHASDYQSSEEFADQNVAVIGSSFSALEIATDVSQTAKRVVSVMPRVPWVVPRFVPHQQQQKETNNDDTATMTTTTTILPVDMAFYQRTKDAPQLPEQTSMSPDVARARHKYLYSITGKRQEQTPLGVPDNWDEPPVVAISDYFLDLVVQGDIDVIKGRFLGKKTDAGWQVESPSGQNIFLTDIDKVICCTGYESDLQNYLHEDILQTLEYDATDMFCPMTACWDTFHPSLPNLFFCGLYRGPYMGAMELQGRLAAGILSGQVELDDDAVQEALETAQQIRTQQPRAQFPHFDYIGFMDTLAKPLKVDFPMHSTKKGDMVSPAFYQSDETLAQQEVEELEQEVAKGQDGSRIPAIVLSAIIGDWNYDRRIVHFSNNHQEHVYGSVRYTRPALDHVLYREDGFYELSPSKTLPVFREYEYQVAGDCLELYFVENGERAHLFLSLKFSKQKEGDTDCWVATSDHLCIKDLYSANFQIRLDGLAATEIVMTYRVRGPAKDYESTTILTPKQGS